MDQKNVIQMMQMKQIDETEMCDVQQVVIKIMLIQNVWISMLLQTKHTTP